MTQEHPIIPPPELLKRWEDQHFDEGENYDVMLVQAYQAGADQELDACCEWIYKLMDRGLEWSMDLRHDRRKPPNLKEQALEQLDSLHSDLKLHGRGTNTDTIRRALESLPS